MTDTVCNPNPSGSSTTDATPEYIKDNKDYFVMHNGYLNDIVDMWLNGLRAVSINNKTKTITYVFLKKKDKPSDGVLTLTWDLNPDKIDSNDDVTTNSQWDTSIDWSDIGTIVKSGTIDEQYFWHGANKTPMLKYNVDPPGEYYTKTEFNQLSYNARKYKFDSWFNSLGIE